MKLNSALLGMTLALGLIGATFAQTSTTPAAPPAAPAAQAAVLSCAVTPLNVSTAALRDLQKIPGINAKLAAAIVKAQPFKDEKDLIKRVKGIGNKNIIKMRPCFLYK